MRDRLIDRPRRKIINCLVLCLFMSSACFAVSSKVIRHNSSAELLKGKAEKVVIGSRGTIQLGRAAESIIREFKGFDGVWSVNSIVAAGGTVYFGTSPNGGIYKYSLGKLTRIYPSSTVRRPVEGGSRATPTVSDANMVEDTEHLSNEHIFAMATDVSGRLLAGISGDQCRLCRFEGDKTQTIFKPEDAKYIFAIAVDEGGSIYLGTGPEGKIYRLDPLGKKAEMIYDSRDKNILSLAVGAPQDGGAHDGCIYAGSDTRGLVYKINTRTKDVTVLYDSEQPEITALLPIGNSESPRGALRRDRALYAAATSAKIVQTQAKFAAATFAETSAGRPEAEEKKAESAGENEGDRKLEIANTQAESEAKTPTRQPPVRKGAKPS
jgi:hypothetical protein